MSKIGTKAWPIGITISIIAVAGLCVWTVKVAESVPVELDNTYFSSYRDLDMNANKIILEQQAFDKKYSVELPKKDFKIGQNEVEIKVTDKQNTPVKDAKIDVVITRPHTTATDQKLKLVEFKNGIFKFEPFEIKDLGRWQIQSKITIDKLTSYNKLEVNATN
jgi:nitrogen fixation protein FixH